MNPGKYSRLVRVTAWVICFVHILMKHSHKPGTSYLTVDKITRAEIHMLGQAQVNGFQQGT